MLKTRYPMVENSSCYIGSLEHTPIQRPCIAILVKNGDFSQFQLVWDRWTDGRTDTPSYRDARSHLKIFHSFIKFNYTIQHIQLFAHFPADFVKIAKLVPWTSEASIWRHFRFPEVAIYNENSKRRLSVKPLLLKILFLHLYLCKMLLFVAIIAKSGQKWRFWRMWHFGAAG